MARATLLHFLFSALRVGIAVYVGLCLVVALRQASYVYYPVQGVGLTPDYFGLEFEELTLVTSDGESLGAWFVPSGRPESPCVLYCHGNGGNIGDRLDALREFHLIGWDVLIFDYRGYGDSTGRPTEQGTYLDATAAWDYLVDDRGVAPSQIVLYGRSLGGGVASWLGVHKAVGVTVIESSFTSAVDMAHAMFPFLPTRLLCRFKYDSLSAIASARSPVLVAHSPDDETIPYKHGRRIFEAAPEPKLFVALKGGHNTGGFDADAAYRHTLTEFVTQHLGVPQ